MLRKMVGLGKLGRSAILILTITYAGRQIPCTWAMGGPPHNQAKQKSSDKQRLLLDDEDGDEGGSDIRSCPEVNYSIPMELPPGLAGLLGFSNELFQHEMDQCQMEINKRLRSPGIKDRFRGWTLEKLTKAIDSSNNKDVHDYLKGLERQKRKDDAGTSNLLDKPKKVGMLSQLKEDAKLKIEAWALEKVAFAIALDKDMRKSFLNELVLAGILNKMPAEDFKMVFLKQAWLLLPRAQRELIFFRSHPDGLFEALKRDWPFFASTLDFDDKSPSVLSYTKMGKRVREMTSGPSEIQVGISEDVQVRIFDHFLRMNADPTAGQERDILINFYCLMEFEGKISSP